MSIAIKEKENTVIIPKQRNEGIELLRIITMFMILLLHYCGKGGFLKQSIFINAKVEIAWLIEAFSIVAVNCYILISGYFLIKSNTNPKKIFGLINMVLFYSISIYCVFKIFFKIDISLKQSLMYFFPSTLMTYWFITCYIALYLLVPYINIVLNNINKESYQKLVVILLFISWASSILSSFGFSVLDVTNGYGIIWFVTLYLIGGYIRIYIKDESKYKYLILYIFISIFVYISRGIMNNDLFYKYNSITVTISSICLFIFFTKIKINNKTIKNFILRIAPLTLAVYIIHEHPLIRAILYNDILHTEKNINTISFIPIMFISCTIIYISCCLIEYVRKKISDKVIIMVKKIMCNKNLLNKILKKDA